MLHPLRSLKRAFDRAVRLEAVAGGAPAFDLTLSPSRADAHEAYARARAASPVCFDFVQWEWIVVGHEAAVWAFKNPQALSSDYNSAFDPLVVGNDPPDHTRYRKILARAMAECDAAMVEAYTTRWMEEFVRRIQSNGGGFDAVQDLACPLPESFTGVMLGLDESETNRLISMRPRNRTQLNASWPLVTAYLNQLVAKGGNARRPGVFGALAAIHGPDTLADVEIVGLLRLLWFAGTSTSTHFLPSLLLLMLKHPDVLEQVRADHELIPAFVNEALRMEGPTGLVPRKAVTAFEFHGVRIPANAMVRICILAANSDPAVFPEPRTMLLNRQSPSVAFGHGIHLCLGAMVAKAMASKVVEYLAVRCPEMQAAQDLRAIDYEPSDSFRSVKSLRIAL
jgi:cytochrome P450